MASRVTEVLARLSITLLCVFAAIPGSFGRQEYIIRHAPSHVRFVREAGALSVNDLHNVMTASYGLANDEVLQWPGLAHVSSFKRPKANVLVSIPGFSGHSLDVENIAKFPLNNPGKMVDTASVINSIQSGFIEHKPLIVDMTEQDRTLYPKVFQDVLNMDGPKGDEPSLIGNLGSLNASKEIDWSFISELEIIRRLTKAIALETSAIRDNIPDFYHFYIQGYQRIVEHYGSDSPQARDAKSLMIKVIDWVTKTFKELYNDNVVVQIVTLASNPQSSHPRNKRSADPELLDKDSPRGNSTADQKRYNVADDYSQDFPAIFNIILFLMIGLLLSVLAISYSMWFMDPGRDSIIYRMTSQRIKKDA